MSASASSGVTSNALATALMASRRVKVDPSRVTGSALVPGALVSMRWCSSISQSSSDTPFSPARARKTSSVSSGPGAACTFIAEGGGEVVDPAGRPGATCAVGKFDRWRAARPSLRAARRRRRCRRACVAGWRGQRSRPPSPSCTPGVHRRLDVDPALRERPEHRLRDVPQLAQTVAPHAARRARGEPARPGAPSGTGFRQPSSR